MENNEKAYYEKVDIDNELKLRKQLAALPPYCKQYFIAIESKTQSRTRLAYAYDLSCFFDYLHENNPICKKMSITEIPLSILESLKPMDLEEYLYNLKVYEKDDPPPQGTPAGCTGPVAGILDRLPGGFDFCQGGHL